MNNIQTIEHHEIIRNTVGYELINKIDLLDLPNVMEFLKVVNNYQKLIEINGKKK